MRVREDGSIEKLVPEIRHPGGDVGYPVFTEFGTDLTDILARAGFETEVRTGSGVTTILRKYTSRRR